MGTTVVSTITARLEADTQQFTADMTQASRTTQQMGGALGGFTVTSGNATRATRLMRGALTSLAITATGVPGPIGHITQALLTLGGGSTAVIAVAAAVAGLALAYRALTADTRDAAKAQEDLIKQLQGVGVHAQLAAARMQLSRALSDIADIAHGPGFWERLATQMGVGPSEGQQVTREQRALSALATANNAVAAAMRDAAQWQHKMAEDAERTRLAHEAVVRALDKMVRNAKLFKDQIETAVNKVMELATGSKARAVEEGRLGFVDRSGKASTAKELIEASFQPSELDKALQQLGVSAGKQFALGLITGIQSMQDLMKSIILQFLSLGLDAFFGSILGAVTSPFTAGPRGKGAVVKETPPVGAASFSLNVAGSLSAPSTPFAVMRDAEWIRVLTGSLIQARANGFR